VLSEFISEMKFAAHPQSVLELALIKMCATNEAPTASAGASSDEVKLLQQKVHQLEIQVQQLGKELKNAQSQAPASKSFLRSEPATQPIVAPLMSVDGRRQQFVEAEHSQMTKKYRVDWPRVMNAVKEASVPLHAWLKEGKPISFLEDAVLIVFNTPIHCETTNKAHNKAILEEKLLEIYGHPLKVTAIQQIEWNKYVANGQQEVAEPLQMVAEAIDEKDKQPTWVREALNMFGESLVEIKHDDKGDPSNEQH
jgi:DNA polymerase-3 subunit gamma/tau